MVTGWFDFTLICVVLRLMQTVDVFFIGGDWKKFRADYWYISFSSLAEANPDKCCFGRCRKIFNAKNAGKLNQRLFGVFLACDSSDRLPFPSGVSAGRAVSDTAYGRLGALPGRSEIFLGKIPLKKMKWLSLMRSGSGGKQTEEGAAEAILLPMRVGQSNGRDISQHGRLVQHR